MNGPFSKSFLEYIHNAILYLIVRLRCWFLILRLENGFWQYCPNANGSLHVELNKIRKFSYIFDIALELDSKFIFHINFFRYYDPPMQYCSRNSTPIQFRISSSMCVEGSCGKYGRCYQFFSGGNMFSTCTCFAGNFKNFF